MAYQNSTHAFISHLLEIVEFGKEITVRGSTVKEITGVHLTINNPLERCYIIKHRNDNVFAKIAESLWVMAGRNDIKFLSQFLPRAPEYSDDGETWRAGYGQRLRHYGKIYNLMNIAGTPQFLDVDQLAACVDLLEDHSTRRAAMVLFDPTVDYQDSKDIPCNNWIHFLIRDEKLNMYVAQRSSDIIFGFSGINTFEWSILQHMMAYWCGVSVGTLDYTISSLHLYDRHYAMADKILSNWRDATIYDNAWCLPASGFCTPFDDIDEALKDVLNAANNEMNDIPTMFQFEDPFLDNCYRMLQIYAMFSGAPTANNIRSVTDMMNRLPDNDFKLAAIRYYERRFNTAFDTVSLPTMMRIAYNATR